MEIHNPFVYLSYGFGIKALLASVLSGIICSAIGSYVVLKRMAFVGAGLSHIAFAGVSFGLFAGISPLVSSLIFTLISAISIWYFRTKKKVNYDTTLGILFATSMALAVIFLSLSGSYSSEALSYLFGSPLTAENSDIFLLLTVALITLVFFFFFWKEIYLTAFSEDIAKASGFSVELITFVLSLLIAFATTLSIKAVGSILVFSLLVMPAASAFKVARNYTSFFFLSLLFGFLSSFIGILISFLIDIPSGAAITFVSFLIFVVSVFLSRN
jgi:zinc transport system permease protein